jgi:competence protein ComEC
MHCNGVNRADCTVYKPIGTVFFSTCLGAQILWNSPYSKEDNHYGKEADLTVTFLPVGQGDATLLEWSDGEVWLIDGGPFTFEMVPYLQRIGIWKIDKVWLSHPHADHMDGIFTVLNQLTVGSLIVGRELESLDQGGRYSALWKLAKEKHIPIQLAEMAQEDDSVVNRGARILHPHDWTVSTSDRCNEESVVLEITHRQHRILFMGDVEEDAEKELLQSVRSVDLLKVAHHGSRSSSSPELIEILKPTVSVITVGEGNRFGHPHPETLWTLRDSTVLRTDWHGMIEVDFIDGGMVVQ